MTFQINLIETGRFAARPSYTILVGILKIQLDYRDRNGNNLGVSSIGSSS